MRQTSDNQLSRRPSVREAGGVALSRPGGHGRISATRPRSLTGPRGRFHRHGSQRTELLHGPLKAVVSEFSARDDPMRVIREDAATVAAQLPSALGDATVLVTGEGGMLGRYVVAILQAAGARVLTAQRRGRDLLLPSEMVDHIIDAGSLADREDFGHDVVGTLTAGTASLVQLLEHARKSGAQLTLVSATDSTGRLDLTDPLSYYPAIERAGEALCAAYREQYGVATSIIRLANLYGPGFGKDSNQEWAEFTRAAVSGEAVVVRSADSRRLPWTYVADAADAVLRTALTGAERDATVAFEAVDDRSRCDIRAFARTALDSAGRPPALAYRLGAPDRRLTDDIEARPGRRPPGWKPRTHVRDGIRRTVRWYEGVLKTASPGAVAMRECEAG